MLVFRISDKYQSPHQQASLENVNLLLTCVLVCQEKQQQSYPKMNKLHMYCFPIRQLHFKGKQINIVSTHYHKLRLIKTHTNRLIRMTVERKAESSTTPQPHYTSAAERSVWDGEVSRFSACVG